MTFTPPSQWVTLVSNSIKDRSGEGFCQGLEKARSDEFFDAHMRKLLVDPVTTARAVEAVITGVRGHLTKALRAPGVKKEDASDNALFVEAVCRLVGAQAVKVACASDVAVGTQKLFKGLVFAFEALQEVHMRDRSHYKPTNKNQRGSKGTVGWDTVILITVVQFIQRVAQQITVIDEETLGALVRNWRKLFVFLSNADADVRKEIARRRGALPMMNALLIMLFQHNNTHQCRILLGNIEDREKQAEAGDPTKSILLPASHLISEVIKFRYYQGRMKLHEKDFHQAFESFRTAYRLSPSFVDTIVPQTNNKRRILFYWVVSGIAMGLTPPAEVLTEDPVISATFNPIIKAMREGDVVQYESAVVSAGSLLRKRGVYMLLQQGKILCWLFLLQRVHAALGSIDGVDNSRIDIDTLVAVADQIRKDAAATGDASLHETEGTVPERWDAVDPFANEAKLKRMRMDISSTFSEEDVMVLWVARLISRGLVKGYLSYEHQCLVLSKKEPFPTLKDR